VDPNLNRTEYQRVYREIEKKAKEEDGHLTDHFLARYIPYTVYKTEHPFIRAYDEHYWRDSEFDSMTETQQFTFEQF